MYNGTTAPYIDVQFVKSGTWTSVTRTDIRSIDIRRGRTREDQRFDAGTCYVTLDNLSGIYDPDITSGTWTVSGVSILKAGLQARIVATYGGTSYILFAGFLETPEVNQGFDATVTFSLVDGLAYIAKAIAPTLSATSTLKNDGETTATRVGRMLDVVGWPAGDRSISGSVQLLATAQGRNVIDIINECVNAEAGKFYVARDGKAVFEPLSAKFSKPTQLEFSDARPQPSNTIEYDEITTQSGALQVVNQAVVRRQEKTQVIATYTSSASTYGTSTVELNAPIYDTSSALTHTTNLAYYLARANATPETRVDTIGFSALALGVLYPDFLATDIGDQIIVNRTTMDGRSLVWYLVVEGESHTITPTEWRVTYNTSPMNPYTITI